MFDHFVDLALKGLKDEMITLLAVKSTVIISQHKPWKVATKSFSKYLFTLPLNPVIYFEPSNVFQKNQT